MSHNITCTDFVDNIAVPLFTICEWGTACFLLICSKCLVYIYIYMYIKHILISNFFIIVRHFMEMAQFIDSALSENGKVFVNCVFGRSRYTVTIIVTFTIFTIIVLAEAKKNFPGSKLFSGKTFLVKNVVLFQSVFWQNVPDLHVL